MFKPIRTTDPADTPVSVSDAKAHLRVVHASDDTIIEAFIDAAVEHLDGYSGILGRCMVTQTWEQGFACWPIDRCLRLPFPDVSGVVLTYLDELADEQTVDADQYEVIEDERGSYIRLRSSFTAPAVEDDRSAPITVALTAGYGAASDVPASIRAAILLIVGDLYENRENTVVGDVRVTEMPIAADRLLRPHRRVGL